MTEEVKEKKPELLEYRFRNNLNTILVWQTENKQALLFEVLERQGWLLDEVRPVVKEKKKRRRK